MLTSRLKNKLVRNFIYLFALLAIVTFSCSDDSDPIQSCDVNNVLTDLPWLVDLIEEEEKIFVGQSYSIIYSGMYRSGVMSKPQRVFVITNCCPNCSMLPPPVYDCAGNMLGRLYADDIEPEKVMEWEIIWKSSDNSCNL